MWALLPHLGSSDPEPLRSTTLDILLILYWILCDLPLMVNLSSLIISIISRFSKTLQILTRLCWSTPRGLKTRCWNVTDAPKSARIPVVNHRYDCSTTAQPVLRSSTGSIFPSWFLINHHQTITRKPFGSSASVIIEELAKHVDGNICVA